MKRVILLLVLLLAVISLTACSSRASETKEDRTQETQSAGDASRSETPVDEEALIPGDEVMAPPAIQTEQAAEASAETAAGAPQAESADPDRPIDLDLTAISGTVVYSQVYDMIMQPEAYLGQKIRIKGSFSYYQAPDTQQEYFAAVVADATACCAQGIEFVWKGEHTFPQDYPPLDTEITVTGIFNTYYEGDNMYIQLIEADVEWDGQ